MTTHRRMRQLRGNKADIPVLEDGELGIVLDNKEVFVGVNQTNLQILTTTSTVDSLTNTSTTLPLSANKGKELKASIDTLNKKLVDDIADVNTKLNQKAPTQIVTTSTDGLMSKTDKAKLDGIETGANKTVVVNNLTSTSTTSALSANQGNILNQNIQGVNTNLVNHNNKAVSSETGVHGIRYHGSQLQVNNPTTNTWDTITVNGGGSGGNGVIADGSITFNKLELPLQTRINNFIKLSDIPLVSAIQNGLMTTADKAKLNALPTTMKQVDVVDNLTSTYTDKALSAYQGKLLRDMITALGYTGSDGGGSGGTGSGEIVLTDGDVYGVAINQTLSSSDPNLVTYTDDALGFVAGAGWDNLFPFNEITPVLLNSQGVETAILDKSDFTKDVNGNAVNITSGDNVMIRIPKIWYNIETISDTVYVKIAREQITTHYRCYAHMKGTVEKDYIYVGAYLSFNNSSVLKSWSNRTATASLDMQTARNYARANGNGYGLLGYHQMTLLQILAVIRSKTLNSNSFYGTGSDEYLYKPQNGTLNKQGMYFKNISTSDTIKVMGIQDFYSRAQCLIDGIKTDNSHNFMISITNDNFNNDGSGYNLYSSGITSPLTGYLSKVQGSTERGFLPKSTTSSTSSIYRDNVSVYSTAFLLYNGASVSTIDNVGLFNMTISYTGGTSSKIFSRIMYL